MTLNTMTENNKIKILNELKKFETKLYNSALSAKPDEMLRKSLFGSN